MLRTTVAWFAAALLFGSPAFAQSVKLQIDRPASDVTVFTFSNANYGSLGFDGSVDRLDMGAEWEFRAHVNLTFHADAKVNRISRVDLTQMILVGTVHPDGNQRQPWPAVVKLTHPISAHLTNDGERRAVRDVTFRVSKEAAAASEHLGLGVSDDNMVWPISILVELHDRIQSR